LSRLAGCRCDLVRSIRRAALEPALPADVQLLHFRSLQARHVFLDLIAYSRLKIGEVSVTLGKSPEQFLIERKPGRWIDGVHAILFVDWLTEHQAPSAVTSLDEIVEPSGTHDIHQHAVHGGSLADRHFRLRNRAVFRDFDRGAAQEVKDADALGPA